jgi:hypothetical protein
MAIKPYKTPYNYSEQWWSAGGPTQYAELVAREQQRIEALRMEEQKWRGNSQMAEQLTMATLKEENAALKAQLEKLTAIVTDNLRQKNDLIDKLVTWVKFFNGYYNAYDNACGDAGEAIEYLSINHTQISDRLSSFVRQNNMVGFPNLDETPLA